MSNGQDIDHLELHRQQVAQNLQEEGEMFAKAFMVPAATNQRKTLKEDIFHNVFWPMFRTLFTGQGEEQNIYQMQLGNWITYAGSVNAEVVVVDVLNKELFVIPAVFDNRMVAPSVRGNAFLGDEKLPSVHQVVKQYELYAQAAPAEGIRYLGEELSKRATIMRSNADLTDYQKAWNKVFEFYGEPPIFGRVAEVKPAATEGGEAEYEFDAP